jgi:hypothetical protein
MKILEIILKECLLTKINKIESDYSGITEANNKANNNNNKDQINKKKVKFKHQFNNNNKE